MSRKNERMECWNYCEWYFRMLIFSTEVIVIWFKKIMRLLQSKRRSAIAPQWRFILKNKAAIETFSNKSIIKLTQLPIGSEGGVILEIRIGVCCTILQIASLFHISFLTSVFRLGFLKSLRFIRNVFLTSYSVCKTIN